MRTRNKEIKVRFTEKELAELDAQFNGDTILDATLANSMQIEDSNGETIDVETDDLSLDDGLDDDFGMGDDFSDDMGDFEE